MAATIRSNCPRDCYDACGIVVTPGRGGAARVAGDPAHPIARGKLCAKCGVAYNGVFQDESARLTVPLRRTGPKGSGQYEPVGWDEALVEIAARLYRVIDTAGADAILGMGYSGTLSLIAYAFPSRLMNYLGASQVDYGTICNVAGSVAWEFLYGTARRGFDPRSARDSRCILVWGANPSHSAPHMHEHWLKESPAKVVVVDPLKTRTAAAADLHLQPRPGTDAALAFALLNALRDRAAVDQRFVAEHTVGFDEIASTIDRCTPQWAEQLTGVPAAAIREAARLYAAGPSLLWCGQGLQRQPGGGNVMRAVGLLPAVTGNVGKPGAGFYYLNDTAAIAGIDEDYLFGTALAKRRGRRVGGLDLADRLHDSDEFRAFIVWNTNPLASGANQIKLRQACSREDLFTVCIELFETDTARYADFILPAASFLEFDDLTCGYMNLLVGAQSKVRDPIGQSLPNQEIFRRLAAAMRLDEPALLESDASMIDTMLAQTGVGYGFEELQRRGHFSVNGDEPVIFFADRVFDTPSGRIEIASAAAEAAGLPRTPLPTVDEPCSDDRVRLISPASEWRMNDSYANEPRLRTRSGEAEILLHAADASRFGVADGDAVLVANDNGEVRLKARIADIATPGTAVAYKGRWPRLEPGANGLNALYDGRKCDMGESTGIHGITVSVVRADA